MAECSLSDLAPARVQEYQEPGNASRSIRVFHEGSRQLTDPRFSDHAPVVRLRVDPWSETAAAINILNPGMSGKETSA
jgi:hypothetical protein